MIKSFRHKGVEQFFKTGSRAKIQPKHADKLKLQLAALDNAKSEKDMNAPGWRLHPLHGDLEDHWSVDVSGNWRLTFTFEGEDAVLVDYSGLPLRGFYAHAQSATSGKSSTRVSGDGVASKVGRNDPCPCGSGKKYKKCCGGATIN
jgi:toxin HigB-1